MLRQWQMFHPVFVTKTLKLETGRAERQPGVDDLNQSLPVVTQPLYEQRQERTGAILKLAVSRCTEWVPA